MKRFHLTDIEISDFCQHLALLMQSGILISDGLLLLAEEEKNPHLRNLFVGFSEQIDQGTTLAQVLADSGYFPDYMSILLKIGEHTGFMEQTLFSLSRYYEEQNYMKRFIKSSLTYPFLLFFMMIIVILVLLTYVLPVFENVYASLGGKLTGISHTLLGLGETLTLFMPFLVLLLAVILFLAGSILCIPNLQNKFISLWQTIFGDKGITRKLNEAHFSQALSMCLSSGLPLEDGLELSKELLQHQPQALARCDSCIKLLYSGNNLADALKESELLPVSACKTLVLGIRSGQSDTIMQNISQRLSEEARRALEHRLSMIEPTLVLCASLLIGIILLTVMITLINIMKTIG